MDEPKNTKIVALTRRAWIDRCCCSFLLLIGSILLLFACSNGTDPSTPPQSPDPNNSGTGPLPPSGYNHINDTGIAGLACVNSDLNLVDCTLTTALAGQDGNSGYDVTFPDSSDGLLGFRFTKLKNDGLALSDQKVSYDTTPWSCVRDENTGLVWEVKTPSGSGLHDVRNDYTWYFSDSAKNLGAEGTPCSITTDTCDTQRYIDAVNSEALCGHSDWRLPTLYELSTLRDFGSQGLDPALDTQFFANEEGKLYWTSTNTSVNSLQAYAIWFVGVDSLNTSNVLRDNIAHLKSARAHIRLVHGGQAFPLDNYDSCNLASIEGQQAPSSRFTLNNDGTVSDKLTGLMWKRCSEGQSENNNDCTGGIDKSINTFNLALETATNSQFAGYDDWRVPNVKELSSLFEPLCSASPMINWDVFPSTIYDANYWTSSVVVQAAGTTPNIWRANFKLENKITNPFVSAVNASGVVNYLRLVRDSQ